MKRKIEKDELWPWFRVMPLSRTDGLVVEFTPAELEEMRKAYVAFMTGQDFLRTKYEEAERKKYNS